MKTSLGESLRWTIPLGVGLALLAPAPRAQTCDFSLCQWGPGKSAAGYAVRRVGDVDADGWPDAIAAGHGVTSGFAHPPNVLVFSARDGRVLHAYDSDDAIATDYGGNQPAPAGDVDADGHADFILQAKSASGNGSHVISGRDGGVLFVLPTLRHDALGDLDGDGHGEIVGGDDDELTVYSGADGSVRFHIPTDLPGLYSWFSYDVAAAGDVDGDGTTDFACRGYDEQVFGEKHFFVRVYSGANGGKLLELDSADVAPFVLAGSPTLAAFGDLDRDGHGDLTLATWNGPLSTHQVVVVSGANGSILQAYFDPELSAGGAVAVPGDIDGDGVPDVLGARATPPTLTTTGASRSSRAPTARSCRPSKASSPRTASAARSTAWATSRATACPTSSWARAAKARSSASLACTSTRERAGRSRTWPLAAWPSGARSASCSRCAAASPRIRRRLCAS